MTKLMCDNHYKSFMISMGFFVNTRGENER